MIPRSARLGSCAQAAHSNESESSHLLEGLLIRIGLHCQKRLRIVAGSGRGGVIAESLRRTSGRGDNFLRYGCEFDREQSDLFVLLRVLGERRAFKLSHGEWLSRISRSPGWLESWRIGEWFRVFHV
jgi:hypothetical protein